MHSIEKDKPVAALPPRSEIDLFDLAAAFGRRDVFDFRIPGTDASHKVECVVMEASDVAAFASALGVSIARDPAAVDQAPKFRRLSDRLEAQRQRVLEPDPATESTDFPRVRMMAAARELLGDQGIAAGGLWPVPGTDPQQYVAIGTADRMPQLVRGIGEEPAEA